MARSVEGFEAAALWILHTFSGFERRKLLITNLVVRVCNIGLGPVGEVAPLVVDTLQHYSHAVAVAGDRMTAQVAT